MAFPPGRDQVAWARRAADFYRTLGWNPLPSRWDRKAPPLASYAECHHALLDHARYADWRAGNVQVVTGARWGLGVVDCDGREATLEFCRMWEEHEKGPGGLLEASEEGGRSDHTTHPSIVAPGASQGPSRPLYADHMPWIVRSGGGGMHFWFRLPGGLTRLESRHVWGVWDHTGGDDWRGCWEKRKNIEILGDGRLVVAPPSLHVATGRRYEWFDIHGPRHTPRPGIMPDWIIGMPARRPPDDAVPDAPRMPQTRRAPPGRPPSDAVHDRREVRDAIADKVGLALSWGLRIPDTRPNAMGWVRCHAVTGVTPGSRSDDRDPSASFHTRTGVYSDMRGEAPVSLSLFDLAVALGRFPDWQSAVDHLGMVHRVGKRR